MEIPNNMRQRLREYRDSFKDTMGYAPNTLIVGKDYCLQMICDGAKPRRLLHGLDYGADLFNIAHQEELLYWGEVDGMKVFSVPEDLKHGNN